MLLKLIWQFVKYLIHRGEQKIIFENLSTGFKCQQDNENDLFDCNAACRLMNQILTLHDSANAVFCGSQNTALGEICTIRNQLLPLVIPRLAQFLTALAEGLLIVIYRLKNLRYVKPHSMGNRVSL